MGETYRAHDHMVFDLLFHWRFVVQDRLFEPNSVDPETLDGLDSRISRIYLAELARSGKSSLSTKTSQPETLLKTGSLAKKPVA